jgi:hypothetical protein
MHFENCKSAGNNAYARNGNTSRVMVASRPKVRFWPEESASPGNYGWICRTVSSLQDWERWNYRVAINVKVRVLQPEEWWSYQGTLLSN